MKQLCQEIEKIIELKGLKKIDIAKQIGVTPTAITKVLKGKATFELILEFLKAVEPDHYLELLTKDDNLLKINTKNWRDTLEFASTNRLLDLQEKLVEKALNSDNPEDKEWGLTYKVLLTFQDEKRSFDYDLYEQCKKVVKKEEMSALLMLLEIYIHYKEGRYNILNDLLRNIHNLIIDLKNSYFKRSMYARILEPLTHISLRVENDIEKAYQYSRQLVESNIGYTYTAFGYYNLALCLIKNDINQSLNYFEKSAELYKKANKITAFNEVLETTEFVKSYFNKLKNVEAVKFPLAKSVCYWNVGENDLALEEIKKIDNENVLTDSLAYFMKGLILNDDNVVFASMLRMVNNGDNFFAQLPKEIVMNKNCYPSFVIDEVFNKKY
jgi:tetratricopeptide (TPR) repeat protein